MDGNISFSPIGKIHSCFSEKFGIPRQAGLAPSAFAELHLSPDYAPPESVRGLEDFSHIWVLFVFHGNDGAFWRPTVRPPRLGGNRRMGVYATRSPFRPNPIGLSAVRLEEIRIQGGGVVLQISGGDFMDGTPVLDIKPYLPYGDSIEQAEGGFAAKAPEVCLDVTFTPETMAQCEAQVQAGKRDLRPLICEILGMDPRPAYSKRTGPFGTRLGGHDVRWHFTENGVLVTELRPLPEKGGD
ncbi:tRNA (N6-threonylcarbamoyladenosine(37)-N6)-methyltransferase TrmO [Desulfobotulus sp.]|uniref:tRNA (N6-threonylcarbamoyladenosine(37)-N6)-methyltransferase TrmO n=1 Tax=Desulfobotulus sp. TaxID=1940337 RepID=UPI002A36C48C|nr:tRNA (N6-threonylcarbamoyladenosine(37)-N6)-methyltransferase TrmO [Desulfobotulus sp.]MDY0163728.1 tRNA (N6-threonylcarbamoyladenosine(37)-N6)-methyltransferase TrmO [Desulfobotulus sp.]